MACAPGREGGSPEPAEEGGDGGGSSGKGALVTGQSKDVSLNTGDDSPPGPQSGPRGNFSKKTPYATQSNSVPLTLCGVPTVFLLPAEQGPPVLVLHCFHMRFDTMQAVTLLRPQDFQRYHMPYGHRAHLAHAAKEALV